jgi:hypothetical protein
MSSSHNFATISPSKGGNSVSSTSAPDFLANIVEEDEGKSKVNT